MGPHTLVGDADGRVRTIHLSEELPNLDRILLDLGHESMGRGESLRDKLEDQDTGAGVDDKLLELAE